MKLPNLSAIVQTGQLRHIQSVYETWESRNPDIIVRDFLSPIQRWGCTLRGVFLLRKLRSDPYYYYLVARTKYYDKVFVDAIYDNAQYIVNIGCGSDTRAYRFSHLLSSKTVKILECDQPEAIYTREQIGQRRLSADHIDYMPIDLNAGAWPDLEDWLIERQGFDTLVMMEGVSPYVNAESFGGFLELLAGRLKPGSRIAYDFKLSGFCEERSNRTQRPFRLPPATSQIVEYHASRGYQLEGFELSSDLSVRMLPHLVSSNSPLFREDGLVSLLVP